MEIKQIEHIGNDEYREFVGVHGTVFNSTEWLTLFGNSLQLFGLYEDQKLQGTFFIYKSRIGIFDFYRCPPFTPHIGFVHETKASNASKLLSEKKEVITLLANHFEGWSRGLVSCAFPTEVADMQPFVWKKFKVIPGYTYQLNLHEDAQSLESRMNPQHRNVLKKAVRDGLVCSLEEDMKLVRRLVGKTFERKGKNLDTELLEKILFEFANHSNSFSFVSWNNNVPIACSFCVFDDKKVYYLLGGYDSENRHSGAGIQCVFSSILHAQKMGKKIFDFEGSMLPEVEKYFRGFGPELVSYFTVQKANFPLEVLMKLVKRHQF